MKKKGVGYALGPPYLKRPVRYPSRLGPKMTLGQQDVGLGPIAAHWTPPVTASSGRQPRDQGAVSENTNVPPI